MLCFKKVNDLKVEKGVIDKVTNFKKYSWLFDLAVEIFKIKLTDILFDLFKFDLALEKTCDD